MRQETEWEQRQAPAPVPILPNSTLRISVIYAVPDNLIDKIDQVRAIDPPPQARSGSRRNRTDIPRKPYASRVSRNKSISQSRADRTLFILTDSLFQNARRAKRVGATLTARLSLGVEKAIKLYEEATSATKSARGNGPNSSPLLMRAGP
jgi:hypothetical protein